MLKALSRSIVPKKWTANLRAFQWRIELVWGLKGAIRAIPLYRRFLKDLRFYRSLPDAEQIESTDLWPCLFDKTATSPIPPHYFYQSAWAARRILQANPAHHIDVGSQLDLLAPLSAFLPITSIDIRPLMVSLHNLRSVSASLLALPFKDNAVTSVSCLHVIEHIGLGRYGDGFDPLGTQKAADELSRILAINGNLFISTPIGRERVCFNAHRVHRPDNILNFFKNLTLVEFSCEDDSGRFIEDANPSDYKTANYACGLFWFKK
ncbi:MAG: DUF268 domain-containing protein [Desulfobaccales bacterium]